MAAKPTPFDKIDCTRCGGTGTHSYNAMHGNRCFGCNGVGYKLTKRGKMAMQYLAAMRAIPNDQICIGDEVLYSQGTASTTAFYKVRSIWIGPGSEVGYPTQPECVILILWHEFHGMASNLMARGKLVRKGFTIAEKESQRDKALAYQATLTKTGKPRATKKIKNT